jgi:hypothetical protein
MKQVFGFLYIQKVPEHAISGASGISVLFIRIRIMNKLDKCDDKFQQIKAPTTLYCLGDTG